MLIPVSYHSLQSDDIALGNGGFHLATNQIFVPWVVLVELGPPTAVSIVAGCDLS